MIKIVILVDIFYKFTAGSERQILELCKNIDQNRFKIYVYCLKGRESALETLRELKVDAACLNIKRIYGYYALTAGIKFARFLKDEKMDVLLTYHFGSDVWGAVFGMLAGVPNIVSSRRDMGFWKKGLHNLAYRIINNYFKKIIVVSKGVRDTIVKSEKAKLEKIEVIYNGIDLTRFTDIALKANLKSLFSFPESCRVIGCVGNFRPVKGHQYLIKSMAELTKQYPDVYLVLAGKYDQNELKLKMELERLIEGLGLTKKIRFLGARDDVPQLLSEFDVCVLPSLSEGLSNTLLEYMASGRPIIATDIAGNNEIIQDGRNGYLVQPADSTGLAKKLKYLLDNKDVCGQIGRSAREDVASKFSIGQMVDHYEKLMLSLKATS